MATAKKPRSKKLIELNAREAAKKAYQLKRFSTYQDDKQIRAYGAKAYKGFLTLARDLEKKGVKNKSSYFYEKALPYAPEIKKDIIQKKISELRSSRKSLGDLINKYSSTFAIVSLASALIVLTFNLTGSAVGGAESFTRWAGVACFVCGLIFAFIHARHKK